MSKTHTNVMLQSNVFNKATAWTGILANSFGLLLFITLIFKLAKNANEEIKK